jgi:hypothetical protein
VGVLPRDEKRTANPHRERSHGRRNHALGHHRVLVVLRNSPYHTLRREAALNVSNLTAWLEIAWILAAATLAMIRRRFTSLKFRVVLLLNGVVVSALVAELCSAILGS